MEKKGTLYHNEESEEKDNDKWKENENNKIIIPPIIPVVQDSYHNCCYCPL
jgi:hypothetical protein